MHENGWRQYIQRFNSNDEELTIQAVPNEKAEEWLAEEVPYFECPDRLIEEIYYYRWWVFRKHIKNIGERRIITEFLPPVYWSGPYNSINCANGHHIAEARWLKKDRHLAGEYINFWLKGEGLETSYSSWIADAVYQYALAAGDRRLAIDVLPELIQYYETVEKTNMTEYGLFWSYDDRDAMELSISGSGLRPTLNSYMYGNASAIAEIAEWAGKKETGELYRRKAEILKKRILEILWDDKKHFFKVIPQKTREEKIPDFCFENIPAEKNVLEEIGYIPWYFSIPGEGYDNAWEYLNREDYFKAPYGITTAERKHPLYMNAKSPHECQWNGPIWPFATTQTLNSLIRLLQMRKTETVNKYDFMNQLSSYARSHYRVDESGRRLNWLDENQHPETGIWLSREILKGLGWPEGKGGYERGKDYNHSAFCDLVIRGICGVQPAEDNLLIMNPLLPEGLWDYFLLEELPYKGHKITIVYDKDGTKYGKGKGFWVEEDGSVLGRQRELKEIMVKL